MSTGRKLVIVESPAKAKTIGGYLGKDWDVEASVGHIRDIPTPSEMPAEIKKGPFGRFGVDVDNGFEAYYVVDADKKKKVSELKRLLKDADELYLATDEDREGEAIAWHLLEVLKPKVPVKRMVFHEITKEAIQRAANNTRDLDTALVDAQETRRILDRLYGYEVSPVLWRKVKAGLSAGRVQSVATRMVVERERERMAFVRASYWDVEGDFTPDGEASQFTARLTAGRRRPRRHRPRLRRRRHAQDHDASPTSTRPPPRSIAESVQAGAGQRHRRPGEALHPAALRAVHHLHAPAGGLAQAAPVVEERHARGPAPLRERLHHLHANGQHHAVGVGPHRGPPAGPRPLRRRVRPAGPAPVREEGQERAGGPRGHPPRGRPLPHPGPGGRRAARRRVRALRADLEAHRRLADGRRPRLDRHRQARRHPRGRPRGRVLRQRHRHHVPRLPRRLRGGSRRRAAAAAPRATRSAACPSSARAWRSPSCAPRPTATRPARRRATPRRRS